MMSEYDLLTEALRLALHGGRAEWENADGEALSSLIELSREQNVLPMLAEAAYLAPGVKKHNRLYEHLLSDARRQTLSQAQRTADFLLLCGELKKRGLDPVVTKGITCRRLYPHPDQRPSVDEDMLIGREEAAAYHRAMLELGFEPVDPDPGVGEAFEISYRNTETNLYIELHTSFFSPDSDAYGDCNAPFAGAGERSVTIEIEDVTLRTLAPTDHLLYLILHAYKHFLHGGVGIRQACDMAMFNERYSEEIDKAHIRRECEKLRVSLFAAGMFAVCEKHLGFAPNGIFESGKVDPEPLLLDMLSGGLYGVTDVNRAHSSTMTLNAVASQRKGRRSRGAWHSVFLPAKDLEGRYPYLKKHRVLLPLAWTQRALGYLRGRDRGRVSPTESLRIGRDRIELLRKYGIID